MPGESRTTVGGPANETRISFARTERRENPEESFRENIGALELAKIYVTPRAVTYKEF